MSNNNSNCMKRGAILVRIYVKSTYYFIHARTDINVRIVYGGKKESVYLAPNGIDIKTKINMNGTYMCIMLYYVPNGESFVECARYIEKVPKALRLFML